MKQTAGEILRAWRERRGETFEKIRSRLISEKKLHYIVQRNTEHGFVESDCQYADKFVGIARAYEPGPDWTRLYILLAQVLDDGPWLDARTDPPPEGVPVLVFARVGDEDIMTVRSSGLGWAYWRPLPSGPEV